ncbi:hypothetical protein LXL04_000539 [Taraxacum kok-saghyz]
MVGVVELKGVAGDRGCAGELYYLLWWRKRRIDIENQNQKLSLSSCSSNYTPTHHSSHISCWKNLNSSKPTKTQEIQQDPEMGLVEDRVLVDSEEESLDLELMRLHNLHGPPRFLTTINEETKEDLESQRSRKGSRTRSLSDIILHFDTPQASPSLKSSQLLNPETFQFHPHGFNPLYEVDINKVRSSPPPTFKFLRDAEEKLLRRLMELEAEKGVNSSAKMAEKDGSFVKLIESKGKFQQISAASKVKAEFTKERTEDYDTTSQLRRPDRGGFPYDILVTSHYFASVALSVRGWVGAWPGLVDGTGTRPGESGRAGLCDLGGLDSGCVGLGSFENQKIPENPRTKSEPLINQFRRLRFIVA